MGRGALGLARLISRIVPAVIGRYGFARKRFRRAANQKEEQGS
jgi:hypothetical protein